MGSVLHNSFVKPLLNNDHKIRQLRFVLNRLESTTDGNYRIKDMMNVVHVDKKWFYVTREKRNVRQFPQEQRHSDQMDIHKSHIQKVLFLAAVGVPRKKTGWKLIWWGNWYLASSRTHYSTQRQCPSLCRN
jgi:hypothetical protein